MRFVPAGRAVSILHVAATAKTLRKWASVAARARRERKWHWWRNKSAPVCEIEDNEQPARNSLAAYGGEADVQRWLGWVVDN